MILDIEWDGANRPFEGEVSIPIQVIPAGARIKSAKVEITPFDPGDSFVETISFSSSGTRWGANKVQGTNFVEVDFRTRRTLASVRGASADDLDGATLQIDPGGAYVAVTELGTIGTFDDDQFVLPDQSEVALPAFVAARFKLTRDGVEGPPDLNSVKVRSVPENISLGLGGNPPFHTFLGQMTEPETSPDFAALLQEFLDGSEPENGFHNIPLVVHSDTIARLRIHVSLDALETQDPLPDGVDESVLSFSFNTVPAAAAASLPLSVPAGARVVAGETSVRLLGAFDDTRVAFGPVVPVESGIGAEISSSAGHPEAQAQPFTLPENLNITGVDLLVRATSVAAQIQLDLRDDLGGKPGLKSLFDAPLIVDLAQKPSGQSEWVSARLPETLKLSQDTPYWLVVQRSLGDAIWSVQPAQSLPLQQTKDGGLSWRKSDAGETEGYFRLRNRPDRFTMPVHVFAGEGENTEEVSLSQYESLGRVDFTLGSDDFAATINRVLDASATGACPVVEHLDNRDFQDWLRVGDTSTTPQVLGEDLSPRAMALSPDGKVLYVLDQSDGARLQVIDPVCLDRAEPLPLPEAVEPVSFGAALAVASDGTALVAHLNGRTWLIDLTTNLVLGHTDDPQLATRAMAPGGGHIYFVARSSDTDTAPLQIARVSMESLRDHITAQANLTVTPVTSIEPGLTLRGAAVSADGGMLHLALDSAAGTTPSGARILRTYDTATRSALKAINLSFPPSGLALRPDGLVAYVGDQDSTTVRAIDLATGAQRGVFSTSTTSDGFSIAGLVVPALSRAYLAVAVERPDISNVLELIGFGVPVPEVWQVTSGSVSPFCLSEPFRIGALLGTRSDGDSPASSISQVVPVASGCPYEFSFWGIAEADGAAAEVLWRSGDCSSPSRDTVPIEVIERQPRNATVSRATAEPAIQLRFHRLRTEAPEGATTAEVRIRTTSDVRAIVDQVSLSTVSPAVANADFLEIQDRLPVGWELSPPSPVGFAFQLRQSIAEFENNGVEAVALSQPLQAEPGSTLQLEFTGDASAADSPPFLLFEWPDSETPPKAILLEPDAARQRLATFTLPADASASVLSLQLPAGSRVSIESLRVNPEQRIAIPINVYAEAPGELSLSDLRFVTDTRPPLPPPAPPGGVCPPTAPGADESGEDCGYCPCCGEENDARKPKLAYTPAARPVIQAECANCGSVVVRPVSTTRPGSASISTGSRTVAVAARPMQILRRPISDLALRPAPSSATFTTGPSRPIAEAGSISLKALLGLKKSERGKLEASGILSIQALAATDPTRVAPILGAESTDRAEALISRAKGLLIDDPS